MAGVYKKEKKMPMFLQAQKIRLDIVNAGRDPFLFDLSAHMDSTLSFPENRRNIASILGYRIGEKGARSGVAANRGGYVPHNYETYLSQMDDYNLAERRRKANERQKARGTQPRKKVSKKDFLGKESLSFWQSDAWPRHPTKDLDESRKAMPPGRRLSRNGYVYYERRRNRSDMPGTLI